MTAAPLEGVKVLDLTRALSGPMCTALLSDMGADVVKVEPFGGEETRNWPPMSDNLSLYWASINRGKRSIELDTRTADGKEVLRRLARGVDVIVENYRPGVLRRVGLDIEELRAENPRLVVASISGHGPVGPLRDVPGLDQIAQGMSGLMSVTGAGDQTPMRVGVPIVDTLAGIFAALAVSAAVAGGAHRRRCHRPDLAAGGRHGRDVLPGTGLSDDRRRPGARGHRAPGRRTLRGLRNPR